MTWDQLPDGKPLLVMNPSDYFKESIEHAFDKLKVSTLPMVKNYLVGLLGQYLSADNLYEEDQTSGRKTMGTLAERFLRAQNLDGSQRQTELKRVGDVSLYVSGFFGDSLKRKLVDIDYYIEIGGAAYLSLANLVPEDLQAKVYEDMAERFVSYVDVLTLISQKTQVQSNKDLLRLYDRYVVTGSPLAREQLIELGLLNAQTGKKVKN